MKKTELIDLISEKSGVAKKTVEEVFNATFDAITDQLENGDSVKVARFGVFSVRETKERQGVNPATGDKITIPAGKKFSFKASKNIKEKLN